jgi:hypothetical protein
MKRELTGKLAPMADYPNGLTIRHSIGRFLCYHRYVQAKND